MPAKSVQLPASAAVAIACLQEHARDRDLSLGAAAAELIERGAATVTAPQGAVPEALSLDELIRLIRARFDERPDHAEALAAAIERADAADARADAAEERTEIAEGKLAQARALFA